MEIEKYINEIKESIIKNEFNEKIGIILEKIDKVENSHYTVKPLIKIIQENPEELRDINDINNIKPIDAWIDNLYLRDNSYSIPELVISLYLTQETVKKCIELIKEFRFDRLTKNNIQEFI